MLQIDPYNIFSKSTGDEYPSPSLQPLEQAKIDLKAL